MKTLENNLKMKNTLQKQNRNKYIKQQTKNCWMSSIKQKDLMKYMKKS